MKSKLNIIEFKKRIKDNTSFGNPKVRLSPFGIFTMFSGISKTFYGKFDDSTFQLTMNSILFPTFYIVNGTYRNSNQNFVVDYVVQPSSKFYIFWFKMLPLLFLFVVNFSFFINREKTTFQKFFMVNIFVVLLTVFGNWQMKRKKKNLERKFMETFEIE